jgi:hypothetical protein
MNNDSSTPCFIFGMNTMATHRVGCLAHKIDVVCMYHLHENNSISPLRGDCKSYPHNVKLVNF